MSDKSVARKLLIKAGYRVLFVNAPESFESTLGELPPDVTILPRKEEPAGPVDLAQVFVTSRSELGAQLDRAGPALNPAGLLWMACPKGTSGVTTDVNRDTIREYARSVGFQAVAMVSVDGTWSALRLKSAG